MPSSASAIAKRQDCNTQLLGQQNFVLTWSGIWGEFDSDPVVLRWMVLCTRDGIALSFPVFPFKGIRVSAGTGVPPVEAFTIILRVHPPIHSLTKFLAAAWFARPIPSQFEFWAC